MKTISIILLYASLVIMSSTRAQENDNKIYFGSVAMDIPVIMHRRLSPLTQYLSEQIKQPVSLRLSPNMDTAISQIVANQVQIAYLTPVAYIRAHEKGDADILVKTITNNRSYFKLMIVVKENSPIKNVEDLAGKHFAFGDQAALLQRAVVSSAIPLNELGGYKFIGHYDNIVRGVLNDDFDAGILKDTKALAWENKGIRIIYSSPELPPYNIATSSKLDPAIKQKLLDALLRLDINNAKHQAVIKALSNRYNGFTVSNDREYDVIRKLIAPFRN